MRIVPLLKTEYVIWHAPGGGARQIEYRYDVSLVWEDTGGLVYLHLIDKRLRDGSGFMILITTGVATEPTGCVMQHGSYLIVSIFDVATYIAWPTLNTPPTPWSWHVETLGKDVCPAPAKFNFPKGLTGDLLVYSAHSKGGSDYNMEYDQLSTTDPSKVILRLPIEADYIRSGWREFDGVDPLVTAAEPDASIAKILATELIPRWKIAQGDTRAMDGALGAYEFNIAAVNHLQHRGYFYKFIAVLQTRDSEGNPVKRRSNPSTDIFVPAVNYSPFFWTSFLDSKKFPDFITSSQNSSGWNGNAPGPDFLITLNGPPDNDWQPIPNLQAMLALQAKYRKYFNDSGEFDGNGTGKPLHWAAHWLRWNHVGNGTQFFGQPPYQCDVSAEELTGAPQTIFEWADFVGGALDLPPDTIQIEVYRTAYEDVDPVKRPVSTPLFKPHVYGLVGTIEPDGTFTDTTKIPDFGQDPDEFEGYLRGEFSGDVEQQYGQSPAIAFTNVRVDYSLRTPSPLVQAFFVESGAVGFRQVDDFVNAADGDPINQFYYCYEDINGFRSPAIVIHTPDLSFAHGFPSAVFFTFPYGYDPVIAHIILFRSHYDAGTATRSLYQIAVIKPEPGTYVTRGIENGGTVAAPGGSVVSMPGLTANKFYEPGAVIYSLPDQPWDWPPEQAEKHHASSPGRVLQVLMGELGVCTDTSFSLTLLRKSKPRSEEETSWLGAITKHAVAKVEDAVVILSQHGLYFLVPSRPEKLPSHVTVQLLSYLTETIPALLPLADLRRASIGYLDRRKELWLHVPSSINLWPKLPDLNGNLTLPNPKAQPQRTFIFRFMDSLRKMENYTFDISPDFEIKNFSQTLPPGVTAVAPDVVDLATYNPAQVLFASGSDGGLWCSYTARDGRLVTLDCDAPDIDYDGAAYGTLVFGLGEASGQKQIARTEVLMQARGDVEIVTGIPKIASGGATSGGRSLLAGWDAIRGFIHDRARVWKFRKVVPDQPRVYNHPASDVALETKGSTVMVRIRTKPDSLGRHKVTLNALTVYLDAKHRHG